MRDPYETLEIDRSASDEDVRRAFRKLAAKYHPDRNPDDPTAQRRFTELNAAYQLLSDPKKRATFDRYGPAAFDPQAGGQWPGGAGFVDLSAGFDGLFGDILNAFGVRTGDRGDLRQTVRLTFTEAALGCSKVIEYERLDRCTRCDGTGGEPRTAVEVCSACNGRGKVRFQQGMLPLAVERTCSRCRGTGRVPRSPCTTCQGMGLIKRKRSVEVTIPEGIEAGSTRTVEGAGNRVKADGLPGNLELVIEVEPHPFFRRSGDDIICAVPITFSQAALGGEVEVPALDGKIKVRVPPSTQSGSVLRIRGKGVPHRLRNGRGDQLIEVSVEIPTHLSGRARELIEELASELGEDVQPQQKTFVEKLRGLFG